MGNTGGCNDAISNVGRGGFIQLFGLSPFELYLSMLISGELAGESGKWV